MISSRAEDYLEEMLMLECTGKDITVTLLAERLKVTKGTVVSAMRKLASAQMLYHERYSSLFLTDLGRRRALDIQRRHESCTSFFHEFLGVDIERAARMACEVEHCIDKTVEERLCALVDFFRNAKQEGQPWVKELTSAMGDSNTLPVPFFLLREGETGSIAKITAASAVRKKLIESGFSPNAPLQCLEEPHRGATIAVGLKGRRIAVPRNDIATVWVRKQ